MPIFVKATKYLGRVLSEQKIHLINGNGDLGLMVVVSQVVNTRGSQVLGIIPKVLAKGTSLEKQMAKSPLSQICMIFSLRSFNLLMLLLLFEVNLAL